MHLVSLAWTVLSRTSAKSPARKPLVNMQLGSSDDPSFMTLMTSRRRMIIFCPKNESSPLLSLNRSWFTDPTSLRRSQAFGFPFGLVCRLCRLRKFSREHLSCLVYLVCEP